MLPFSESIGKVEVDLAPRAVESDHAAKMGIFQRLDRIIKGELNAILERIAEQKWQVAA